MNQGDYGILCAHVTPYVFKSSLNMFITSAKAMPTKEINSPSGKQALQSRSLPLCLK